MRFINTRDGESVSGLDAIVRGLSNSGGIFVPEFPPETIDFHELKPLSSVMVMATFFHRFLPDFSIEEWRLIVDSAMASLSKDDHAIDIPFCKVNQYLPNYFLLSGDDFPTGTLDDFSTAVFCQLLPRALEKRNRRLRPYIMIVSSDDFAISALRALSYGEIAPAFVLLNHLSDRRDEAYVLKHKGSSLLSYKSNESALRQEFARLSADLDFEQRLFETSYEPVFLSDSNPLKAIAAGALVAASLVELDRQSDEMGEEGVDFVIAKDDLAFLTGLVYASSASLPVARVYVGEGESQSLTTLFTKGALPFSKERKEREHERETRLPINFEVLLFELFGRDNQKLIEKMGVFENDGTLTLNYSDAELFCQSFTIGSCEFKRCQKVILTVYDKTDYLIGRGTAEAIACWASHSNKNDTRKTCFVSERSPLLDHYICSRSLFGANDAKQTRREIVEKLSEEASVSPWTSLRQSFECESTDSIPTIEGSLRDAVLNTLY